MTDAPVVRLDGLSKSYGKVVALRELTLEIPPGLVGLLGPNGAGKTTLLKLLLGLLKPNAGSASIAGRDPRRRSDRLALRRAIGYMPEGDCLLPGMNAVEIVGTLGRLTGLSQQDAMKRAHETLDYVGIDEERYRGVDQYSTGMKQRLKLAQALAHDPELLLLDEPTNGLDPRGRREMLELIRDLGRAQGKNILLCSHLLPDVERTCRDVVVLDRGRVIETGRIAEMTRSDGAWVDVDVAGTADAFATALADADVPFERATGRRFRVRLPEGSEDVDFLFALAQGTEAWIAGVQRERSTLEDVFVRTMEAEGATP